MNTSKTSLWKLRILKVQSFNIQVEVVRFPDSGRECATRYRSDRRNETSSPDVEKRSCFHSGRSQSFLMLR